MPNSSPTFVPARNVEMRCRHRAETVERHFRRQPRLENQARQAGALRSQSLQGERASIVVPPTLP